MGTVLTFTDSFVARTEPGLCQVYMNTMELPIIFEDNHLLAVYKPAGILSQGDATGDENVVTWAENYLRKRYQKAGNVYVGLLHRLDRPTSGILLLAKTSKEAARMSEQFRQGTVSKHYFAITTRVPKPESQELCHHLKKIPGKNIIIAYNHAQRDTQEARLSYQVIHVLDGMALLAVEIFTGRQHQIRVQLARIACPILGDAKYGKIIPFLPDLSIALTAYRLDFLHPIQKNRIQLTFLPQSINFQPFKDKMQAFLENSN